MLVMTAVLAMLISTLLSWSILRWLNQKWVTRISLVNRLLIAAFIPVLLVALVFQLWVTVGGLPAGIMGPMLLQISPYLLFLLFLNFAVAAFSSIPK